jgi:hypothetical protein
MFDRISEKLKTIANVLFKIAIVLAIIMGIAGLALLSESSGATVALIISAGLTLGGSYISSALIYGFAELIEKTMSTNLHIANMNANAIPKLVANTNKETPEGTKSKAE